MLSQDYILELRNVSHTGAVEPGTFFQKLVGIVRTGVILKDVSLEVHGGEIMAVLGSKGSGKRALLEVISRRAQGSMRGDILLNNAPTSQCFFQDNCAYVTQKCHLLPGLTTRQTLYYSAQMTIGSRVSSYVKKSRVKQVLADLALTQVANWSTGDLTVSEYRRLVIGTQIIKDPVVLLLDEPTSDLDPLNTYFIISILSNHAKKYNRIVLLTMEKPRSDIFPFLDRVTYLCLGDVVYTGSTRMMLDYFRNIGFPCPELENPLMYYLCLSTVDRRSRERFVESTNQIGALVEKFKMEGAPFRKYAGPPLELEHSDVQSKVPLTAFGRPSFCSVFWALVMRAYACTFNFRKNGLKEMFLRLVIIPLYFLVLWAFYYGMKNYQQSFVSRSGLIFNCLAGSYLIGVCVSAWTFGSHRTRFFQETREGLYIGAVFIFSQLFYCIPLALIAMLSGSRIIYEHIRLTDIAGTDDVQWLLFAVTLLGCYLFAEQQTIGFMLIVKNTFTAATCSIYFLIVCITLGSGSLRTIGGLEDWLLYLSYMVQPRYAGSFLHQHLFNSSELVNAGYYNNETSVSNCTWGHSTQFGCRYTNGTAYLKERYPIQEDEYLNLGIVYAFYAGMLAFNFMLYVIPLPGFVKAKFRD